MPYLAKFGEELTHLFLTVPSATLLFHIYMVDGWRVDGLVGGWYLWYNTRVGFFVLTRGGTVFFSSTISINYWFLSAILAGSGVL